MSENRVLHVVTALGVGGVEVWLIALLEHIQKRAEQGATSESFDILMTGGRTADLDERARTLGATLYYIPFGRKRFFSFAKDFRRLLSQRKYSAIHDHQDYSGAWHLLAGSGALPPTRIVHVHNPPICLRINTDTMVRKGLFQISKRLVRALATHVLGTSTQVLHEYGFERSRFPRQEIRTLHCGFDVGPFTESPKEANESVCRELGWPAGSRICIFVGRLDGFDPSNPAWNHKNPQFALEVVRKTIEEGTDMRFIVAGGGGEMRELLESRVTSWGLSDRITFTGRRADVARLMAASHACLFPSLEEGLGMVAVEAQAAGLRVLASDTVPREAVVLPDLVSFLPLGAGVETWARDLTRLMSLRRFDSATAAREVTRSAFSIENSYARLHEIYSAEGRTPPSGTP